MATNLKDLELLEFINKKKCDSESVNTKKIFFIFLKILCNTLYSSFVKLDKVSCSISCSDMIFSIFWIIFNYTYNLKLSMFLCERGVVLFVEYINLSNGMEDSNKINMIDVKLFIYKKTLGPLLMNNMQQEVGIESVYNLTNLVRHFVCFVFSTFSGLGDINSKLEYVCTQLGSTVYKVYMLVPDIVQRLLHQCQDSLRAKYQNITMEKRIENENDFFQSIMLLKLKLELIFANLSQQQKTVTSKVQDYVFTLSIDIPTSILQGQKRLVETDFFDKTVRQMHQIITS